MTAATALLKNRPYIMTTCLLLRRDKRMLRFSRAFSYVATKPSGITGFGRKPKSIIPKIDIVELIENRVKALKCPNMIELNM